MCLFQNERWAVGLLTTIGRYTNEYDLHDFVIMPDHVHLLLTPNQALERSVQLIKGGFWFSARRAFAWKDDIWQPGFTDHRIRDASDWRQHLLYIETNIASLNKEEHRFCGSKSGLSLAPEPQWLKPLSSGIDQFPG